MSEKPSPDGAARLAEMEEDEPLLDRIARNPQPALLWLAGVALLVAVELGALVRMLIVLGDQVNPLINGTEATANWLIGTASTSLGPILGLVVAEVILLATLVVVAAAVKALFIPFSLTQRLGLDDLSVPEDLVERTLVTLLLLGLVLLYLLPPVRAAGDAVISSVVALLANTLGDLPTLLSRDLIPNNGYQTPDGSWTGTFLGLSPAVSWGIRVALIYVYSAVWIYWLWRGYETFRAHYRYADWTPRDDIVDRFSGHYWGQFGMLMVFAFLVMALFAPALGPTTVENNIYDPYDTTDDGDGTALFEYYDAETGELKEITHGAANSQTVSQGNPENNVGPMSYDQYNRFHPFGTMTNGKDLFTFMMAGARISLFIGTLSIAIAGGIATVLALVTSYYKGVADLLTVVVGDSIQALPALLVFLLVSWSFSNSNHGIVNVLDGGFLLALMFGLYYWPALWRAVRGPALQVSEQEWIDAAKSFGQRPTVTMRKHMAPYIAGYLLIYASLTIGGIIIATAALSFLGVGINPPTPEWGRAVDEGRLYVTTVSWHMATIPGVMITLVVLGFNAFGDGIRDAIDPQSEGGTDASNEAGASGGGG